MKSNKSFFIVLGLMITGIFARLIPHIPNFTPTESIAIFGAAYLGYRYLALLLPIGLIYTSDFILNNTIARPFFPNAEGIIWYDHYMLFTAIAIVSIVLLSKIMLKTINTKNVIITVITGTLIFFMMTNFGAWASAKSVYPANVNGLLMAYIAGLPFLKASLLGNLVFSGILFGSKAVIERLLFTKQVRV